MKFPIWVFGSLLWDVARYVMHYLESKEVDFFIKVYEDIPTLQLFQDKTMDEQIREARSLALGYDLNLLVKNNSPKALRSIFSAVKLRDDNLLSGFLPIQPLHQEPTFHETDAIDVGELKKHLKKFVDELRFLNDHKSSHKLETILSLIEKYFWCLAPWDLEEDTDVSLYALAKMSTAIMSCWPRDGSKSENFPKRDEPVYSLICGDISGIQKYIYRISSAKGAAKGLKARSFELAILSDAIAKHLLIKFSLPITNLIYSSGGKFYILAPDSARDKINKKEKGSLSYDLASRFWKHYEGDLFLGLGAVPLSGNDFMADNFGGKWQEVTVQCNISKQSKFQNIMQAHYADIFTARGEGGEAKTCDVCQREESKEYQLKKDPHEITGEREICPVCEKMEKLGRALAKANLIAEVIGDDGKTNQNIPWLNPLGLDIFYYILTDSDKFDVSDQAVTFFNLNIHEYPDEKFLMLKLDNANVNCAFRFYGGNEIPKDKSGEPLDYNDLAEASQGIKRLGVLRMDVDFLGRIFAEGLKPLHDGLPCNPAARVLTLSWHLNYYFSGRLNKLRRKISPDHSLIVYSGGDDLFIVGAWDKAIEMAQEIQQDFSYYTGNREITISGGMVIVPEKFPIHKSAILSGKAEEAAKEVDGVLRRLEYASKASFSVGEQKTVSNLDSRKDGITFLDKSLRWRDFDIVVSIKDALYTALTLEPAEKRLDSGILTRLRQIYTLYEMPRKELRKLKRSGTISLNKYIELIDYNKWRWHLVYALYRYKEHHKEHEGLINNLQRALIHNEWQPCVWKNDQWEDTSTGSFKASKAVSIVSFIDVPARWAELLLRKEK